MNTRALSIPVFDRVSGNPVITPDPSSAFDCPMRGRSIRWEALHTFSPAAVVKDGKVYLLYRAEDDTGAMKIGAHTSRLGLAVSDDGIHFTRERSPVLFPADDAQKENEWDGGCEDPRLIEAADGTYVLTYTQWNRKRARLAIATSRDLRTWTKQGPAFPEGAKRYTKSGAIVCSARSGRLIASKVNGRYLMYWGENNIHLAVSDDLTHWDAGDVVLPQRKEMFDSSITEAGPPAVITDDGIVVLYNGSARGNYPPQDPRNRYGAGCAIFDPSDPCRCIARTDAPFFKPEASYEVSGQYAAGDVFLEGLVHFRGKWFIYYGAADSCVAVVTADALPSLA